MKMFGPYSLGNPNTSSLRERYRSTHVTARLRLLGWPR
jgi:hypothetical protein